MKKNPHKNYGDWRKYYQETLPRLTRKLMAEGWLPLKTWLVEKAQAEGVTVSAMHSRYFRRRITPKIKRINARVVFVKATSEKSV